MDLKLIGLNIKNSRKRKNITQAQLAEATNLSTNHISHIENGSSKMSLDTLVDICNALNISPNEILWGVYKSTDIQTNHINNHYPITSNQDIFKESPDISNIIFSTADSLSAKNKRILLEITKLLSEQ